MIIDLQGDLSWLRNQLKSWDNLVSVFLSKMGKNPFKMMTIFSYFSIVMV